MRKRLKREAQPAPSWPRGDEPGTGQPANDRAIDPAAGEAATLEQAGEAATLEHAGEAATLERAGEAATLERVGEAATLERAGEAATLEHAGQEEILLLGQPPLRDYLSFTRNMVVGGAAIAPKVLTDEWRAANDYYHELEEREAGLADRIECRPLDPALAPLCAEVIADPRYRCTFDTVPAAFQMVELDRLVVYQTQVTRHFVEGLKVRLGPEPDAESLFRFCMPLGQPQTPLKARRIGSRRFVFSSYSMDVRYHEPVLLRPDQIRDYHSFGAIGGVVGLVIGYSANFLTGIRDDNRILLHNGYHRACAMRALGITHAPAIVQRVTRRDELDVVAPSAVAESPGFYFKAARPPLLKDFFDPRIRKVVPVHKIVRMVEVNFEVREFEVPE